MSDDSVQPPRVDGSIPPIVPPDGSAAVRSVFRTPWARRWAFVVALLMLAWTAIAWDLNGERYESRVDHAIDLAAGQARARAALVEDGLRQGLSQLDGVARVLARAPTVAHAVLSAGNGAQAAAEPPGELRDRLQAQPELAAMNGFLASSADELGADLVYLLDDAGNCVAASNAGTAGSVVGQHLVGDQFFSETRVQGARACSPSVARPAFPACISPPPSCTRGGSSAPSWSSATRAHWLRWSVTKAPSWSIQKGS